MKTPLDNYRFEVTPIFDYIKGQVEIVVYLHYNQAKETMQLFLSEESFNQGDRYIGAIQYEGSNNYEEREPHLVSLRFKRSNLPEVLKNRLEEITEYRRDKNTGPAINPEAESIAFKFEVLNNEVKDTIEKIINVFRYC